MSRAGRYINRYRLFWLGLLAVFALFIYWLLFIKPASPLFTEIDPGDVKTTSLEEQGEQESEEPSVGEQAPELSLNAEEAEFSFSSIDGELIMRLWAETANKQGPEISVKNGVLQFQMKEGKSLVVRVDKCTIRLEEDDLMTVSGDITGNISGTGQYFSGSHLTWDRQANEIEVAEVYYVGKHIEVRGQQMHITMDPENPKVTFEGQVEAGV